MTKIIIDSSNRLDVTESSTDFNVDLKLAKGGQLCTLQSLHVPLSWSNIDHVGLITVSGTVYTVTLAGRFPDITIALLSLEQRLSALTGYPFQVSADLVTGQVTVALPGTPFSLDTSTPLWGLLGAAGDQNDLVQTLTFRYPHLLYEQDRYLLLSVANANGNIHGLTDNYVPGTFVIDLPSLKGKTHGEVLDLSPNLQSTPMSVAITGNQLDYFRVQLRDHRGRVLDLQNRDFYAVLEIS
jgi:hypothetical protein